MRGTRKLTPLLAGLAALATVLVACGDNNDGQASAGEGTFVGKVEGSDAYVALVANGREVTGYLCDGKQLSTGSASPT